MNFLSSSEIGKSWGITSRRVNILCTQQRIPGAQKIRGRWLIPENADKPHDRRQRRHTGPPADSRSHYRTAVPSLQQLSGENSGSLHVKDLFTLGYFQDWKLVGGAAGLDHEITSLNMMESPDMSNWVKKNQFIISTGYCIRDDINVQKQIIFDLGKIGCAGLAIKIMRFFRTIPQHMIDMANQYGIPLIEIPDTYNISEVLNEITKKVYARQLEKAEFSYKMFSRFARAAFQDNEFKEIAANLGELLHCDIMICDAQWQLLGSYIKEDSPTPLTDYLSINTPLSPKPIGDERWPVTETYRLPDREVYRIIFPVDRFPSSRGYISIFSDKGELTNNETIAVTEAVSVIQWILGRYLRKNENILSQIDSFIQDLIFEKINCDF